jgi:hypothetical protein
MLSQVNLATAVTQIDLFHHISLNSVQLSFAKYDHASSQSISKDCFQILSL